MKSKGIKNLLIDLGGVLINLDRQRCIENFQKLGLGVLVLYVKVNSLEFYFAIVYSWWLGDLFLPAFPHSSHFSP